MSRGTTRPLVPLAPTNTNACSFRGSSYILPDGGVDRALRFTYAGVSVRRKLYEGIDMRSAGRRDGGTVRYFCVRGWSIPVAPAAAAASSSFFDSSPSATSHPSLSHTSWYHHLA